MPSDFLRVVTTMIAKGERRRQNALAAIQKHHSTGCHFRTLAELTMETFCPHGLQCCPVCEPCNCGCQVPTEGIQ
jgi:hypothetical protein